MIMVEDEAGIARINNSYLLTDDSEQGDNKNSWKAYTEFTRLQFGKGGSFSNLEALADKHPDSSKTLEFLARWFREYKDYEKAGHSFERAASVAADTAETLRLLGLAAVEYQRAGLTARAGTTFARMQSLAGQSEQGELEILKALRNSADLSSDVDLALATMERVVEINPSDTDTRFSLAYKYSENDSTDVALFHYQRIPDQERHAVTWNNIGVAFDTFSIAGKAVEAFRRAEGMGDTLAMSNIARKLTFAGFLPEAQKQCADAMRIENYYKSIAYSLTRLAEIPEEEIKREEELLNKAKPKSEFYRQFGRAASQIAPSKLVGQWEGPDCALFFGLDGEDFVAMGSYEKPSTGLMSAALLGAYGAAPSKPEKVLVKYKGKLRGRGVSAYVTREPEKSKPSVTGSLLGSMEDKTKVLMVLTDDGSEIKAMELRQGGDPRFYLLKRETAEGNSPG